MGYWLPLGGVMKRICSGRVNMWGRVKFPFLRWVLVPQVDLAVRIHQAVLGGFVLFYLMQSWMQLRKAGLPLGTRLITCRPLSALP